MISRIDRIRGSLFGLAVGDALGTTLEFSSPGSFEPLHDMVGGGPFGLSPGQWTDDTSMALCLTESLIHCEGFDPVDQMQRYIRWWRSGYMSSTGVCFDIGTTVQQSLMRFLDSGEPFAGSTDPDTAGNGSLMRLAPVALYYADDPMAAIEYSGESSRTTHAAQTCIDACRYYGGLIAGALMGAPKETLLSDRWSPVPRLWLREDLCEEIDEVAAGSFRHREPPQIKGTGYVVRSLEAALWAFYHSQSFADGCLLAVNLGDDSDTTGAIYGQLAGAYYGYGDIPEKWLSSLSLATEIEEMCRQIASTDPNM